MRTSLPFENIAEVKETPTWQAVWEYMRKYQKERGMPPTLAEIADAHPSLNWRSSARHVAQRLVADGWVIVENEGGESRRYRAVEPGAELPKPTFQSVTKVALPPDW